MNDSTTGMPDMEELLEHAITLARDAASRILDIYRRDFDIETKEDRSPLTEADLAAHNALLAGFDMLTPDLPVLSEESASIPFAERSSWSRYWLIDPLDGTKEFIKRNGEFTVNIALIQDGEPVLGVVQVPVSGVVYYAARGQGAWKQVPGSEPERIHVRKLGDGPVRVAGSRSHAGGLLADYLKNLGDHELLRMGSALKSCLVAEGVADLYPRLGPTSEWDTAAAHCVVLEAGGHLTDTRMRPLRYNTKESLLNPHFFVFGDDSRDWSRYLPR